MKTNSIKDLGKLFPNRELVYSCKPSKPVDEFTPLLRRLVLGEYIQVIIQNRRKINELYRELYGFVPIYQNNCVGETLINLKNLSKSTGKSISQLKNDIQSYIGYPCCFYRYLSGRKEPVPINTIKKAHELVVSKQPFTAVEDVLYIK